MTTSELHTQQINYVSQALYETLQTTQNYKNDNSSKMSWLPSPPRITDLQLKLHVEAPPTETSHGHLP